MNVGSKTKIYWTIVGAMTYEISILDTVVGKIWSIDRNSEI